MEKVVTYAQMILAILVAGTILLQQRGTGITSLLGGGSMEYSTKRGAEKVIFTATIVLTVLFIAVSIVRIAAY